MLSTLPFLVAASVPVAHTAPGAPVTPGNVVVIVIDDVGVDLIGAYDAYFQSIGRDPGTPANTPAIDRLLADQGLLFANAWGCPSCSPSRAQMLTGRHAFRTGIGSTIVDMEPVPSSNPGLALTATLLPELMRASGGYTCVAVGKWHIADMDQIALDLAHPLGSPHGTWFDRYAGSLFNLSRPNGVTPGLSIYNDWLETYASELLPGVNPCAAGQPPCQLAVTGAGAAYYATVVTADEAIAVAATLPEPWFLWVAFNASHAPVGHAIPSPLPASSCGAYVPPSGACAGGTIALDKRCVTEALDTQVGRFLCTLDASDTTVILVGDNGSESDAILAPFDPLHGKGTLYEGGLRVPLIVRSPLLDPARAGTATRVLASGADLFATLTELAAGAPGVSQAEDSISLMPYLAGQVRSIRQTLYSESFVPNFTPDALTGAAPAGYFCQRQAQALRTQRFKLIRRWKRSHQNTSVILLEEEFYDLTRGGPPDTSVIPPQPTPDPYEQNDLLLSGVVPGSLAARTLAALRLELDTRYPTLVH